MPNQDHRPSDLPTNKVLSRRSETRPMPALSAPGNVPALPSTLMQLELLLSDLAPDLGAVTGLVQNDVGATLHVYKRIWQEHGDLGDREDLPGCIAQLGIWEMQELVRSIPMLIVTSQSCPAFIAWRRAKITAVSARLIAMCTPGVSANQAHIAGLLHDLGDIASCLGWKSDSTEYSIARYALRWDLPEFVVQMLAGVEDAEPATMLARVTDAASVVAGFLNNDSKVGGGELSIFLEHVYEEFLPFLGRTDRQVMTECFRATFTNEPKSA